MLTISQQARDVVRKIPNQPGLPSTAGLRLAVADNDRGTIRVLAANRPRHGDRTFDYEGARLFLDPLAIVRLEDRMLDVETRPDGRLQFRSVPQEASRSAERAEGAAAA
jgi:Fe-S cluster assembly iron-binding protein IscA